MSNPGERDDPLADARTALAIPVLEFRDVLQRVAQSYPDAVRETVPPHLTVAYPFLPASQVDTSVETELAKIFEGQLASSVSFTSCHVVPRLVYTVPVPDSVVTSCRDAVDQRWPQVKRARRSDDVGPHLTLALGDTHAPSEVESLSSAFLPVRSFLSEVWLLVQNEQGWTTRRRFPLSLSDSPSAAHGGRL